MKTKKAVCRCREPKKHRDCMYCGCGWMGEVVCGVCKEAGIDGKLIRGTGRVVCKLHKERIDPGAPGTALEQRADLMTDEERKEWIANGMP